jgi:outer membrane lipoprotein-sorting protein
MIGCRRLGAARAVAAAALLFWLGSAALEAQQTGEAAVIRGIDAAVQTRIESIAGYTVNERYAVFRGSDETHPVAEMAVKTVYRQETGKSYTIVSQSGPEIVRKMAFGNLLESEKNINLPGNREASWFTSANYEMKLKPGGAERLDGRECLAVAISPRRKAPNLIEGTLWVDAKDYTIVRIQGTASKSPSLFAGATQMMREYANVSGFAMATHARATSNVFLLGKITVTIDYSDYQIQLRTAK